MYMQATSDEIDVLDIGSSIINYQNIVASVPLTDALFGFDNVAPFFGLGKIAIVTKFSAEKS